MFSGCVLYAINFVSLKVKLPRLSRDIRVGFIVIQGCKMATILTRTTQEVHVRAAYVLEARYKIRTQNHRGRDINRVFARKYE